MYIFYTYFNWNMLWCAVTPINYKPIYLMTQKKSNFQKRIFKNKTEARSKILVIFIATHYRDKHLYLDCILNFLIPNIIENWANLFIKKSFSLYKASATIYLFRPDLLRGSRSVSILTKIITMRVPK